MVLDKGRTAQVPVVYLLWKNKQMKKGHAFVIVDTFIPKF